MVTSYGQALNTQNNGIIAMNNGTFTTSSPTQHYVLVGGSGNTVTSVAPSATSGVPVISQGASADPTFGTAVVAGGGTGLTSATAYAVLCGGTSTTGAFQSIASVGTSGQVLTSNGASALPTFQAAATAGSLILISTQTASNSASIVFTSGITSTYTNYLLIINNFVPVTNTVNLVLRASTDGGSTYLSTGYNSNTNWFNTSTPGNVNTTTSFFNSTGTDNTANLGFSGTIYLFGIPTANEKFCMADLILTSAAAATRIMTTGYNTTTTAVNALQLTMSSGNISTGSVSLYGIAN